MHFKNFSYCKLLKLKPTKLYIVNKNRLFKQKKFKFKLFLI